jgi:UDP-3-O-[3-hydroxymyristoyl] N-acetylglucosamine deacetylase
MIDWQEGAQSFRNQFSILLECRMSSLRDRTIASAVSPARRTLKAAISCLGHGLHSGVEVSLRLVPAASGTGILFRRTDLNVDVPARFDQVSDTRLCTVIGEGAARIGTIEHLMAALAASRVDDVIVEVDAPELPIFDGSAAPFLFLIESAGLTEHEGTRETIEILRNVRVERDGAFAELRPHGPGGAGFDLCLAIDFAAAAIGAQAYRLTLTPDAFAAELATARTFTQAAEIEALRAAGLAKGGSLANAIVVDGAKILNPEGLRFDNEFVRHKLLDVVGDLALAGAAISGRFLGSRTGHALNNALLHALFADPANYRRTRAAHAEALQLSAA